jgi:hypothetical protein
MYVAGFYLGGSSEAGSGARQLTGRHLRLPVATPSHCSPLHSQQQQQLAGRVGAAAAGLQPSFDAAGEQPSPYSGDPIASLSHIAAYQEEAEAAVDRAAQAALKSAAQQALRPLPPPPLHLQSGAQRGEAAGTARGGKQPAAVAKRPLLEAVRRSGTDLDNRQLEVPPVGGKRAKAALAAFACSGKR